MQCLSSGKVLHKPNILKLLMSDNQVWIHIEVIFVVVLDSQPKHRIIRKAAMEIHSPQNWIDNLYRSKMTTIISQG